MISTIQTNTAEATAGDSGSVNHWLPVSGILVAKLATWVPMSRIEAPAANAW
jgi:hypothetical protein